VAGVHGELHLREVDEFMAQDRFAPLRRNIAEKNAVAAHEAVRAQHAGCLAGCRILMDPEPLRQLRLQPCKPPPGFA